jgi:hypothetical protein
MPRPVCQHPHCNDTATDEVVYPAVRWVLCADHAAVERRLVAQVRASAIPEDPTRCVLPDCAAPVRARGLCCSHYQSIVRRRGMALPHIQRQAALALDVLPGSPPPLPAVLADQPAWIQRRAEALAAEYWARFRQELYQVAGRTM